MNNIYIYIYIYIYICENNVHTDFERNGFMAIDALEIHDVRFYTACNNKPTSTQ